MSDEEAVLERRDQPNRTPVAASPPDTIVMLTPPINPDYWAYRVRVAEGQAVVGFPKFSTIGIGFAEEEDWNANLPYTSDADAICAHIWHNRGPLIADTAAERERITAAIRLIQAAAEESGA